MATFNEAWSVSCPECGAKPKDPCTAVRKGKPHVPGQLTTLHNARLKRADEIFGADLWLIGVGHAVTITARHIPCKTELVFEAESDDVPARNIIREFHNHGYECSAR